MTTTEPRPVANRLSRSQKAAPTTAPIAGRRRRGFIALGVLLAVLGVLSTMWIVSSVDQRTPVAVIARDVAYGEILTADDLAVADVAVDAIVDTVTPQDAEQLVGQVAASDLTAGSLLTQRSVQEGRPPAAGQMLVSLTLTAERVPVAGLNRGDRILVVDTPAADGDVPAGAVSSIAATVTAVSQPDDNGQVVLDVVVPNNDGPALAIRSATGRYALTVVSRGAGE